MPLLCLLSSHFSNWNISAILNDIFIFAKTLKAIRGQYWLFTCQIPLLQWKLLLSYCTQAQKASQIILHTLQAKPKRNHHLKEKKKPFIKEMFAPKSKPCVSLEQSVKLELWTPGKKQTRKKSYWQRRCRDSQLKQRHGEEKFCIGKVV